MNNILVTLTGRTRGKKQNENKTKATSSSGKDQKDVFNDRKKDLNRSISFYGLLYAVVNFIGFVVTLSIYLWQRSIGSEVSIPVLARNVFTDTFFQYITTVVSFEGAPVQIHLLLSMGFLVFFIRDCYIWVNVFFQIDASSEKSLWQHRLGAYSQLFILNLHPLRYITAGIVLTITDIAILVTLGMQWAEFLAASSIITFLGISSLALLEWLLVTFSWQKETYKAWIISSVILVHQLVLFLPWIGLWLTIPDFYLAGVSSFYWTLMSFRLIWTTLITFPILFRMKLFGIDYNNKSNTVINYEDALFRTFPAVVLAIEFAMLSTLGTKNFIY
jgi:hypothetical protein